MAVIAVAAAAGDDLAGQAGGSRAVPAVGPESWAGTAGPSPSGGRRHEIAVKIASHASARGVVIVLFR
jgi:hypothetical protein